MLTPYNSSKPPTQFYDNIYRLLMSIRKLQKPPRRPPPPRQDVDHPPPAEMKYTGEAAALFPDSAARWRARGEHLSK